MVKEVSGQIYFIVLYRKQKLLLNNEAQKIVLENGVFKIESFAQKLSMV